MAKLRLEPFEDIGDPAILLNGDRDGFRMFQSAVRQAHETGEASFEFDGIAHRFVREKGTADVELGPRKVLWRFSDEALSELLDLIPPLIDPPGPGHQYVDLTGPVDLLVLSVDEYPRHLGYGVFSELYPPTTQAAQQSALGLARRVSGAKGMMLLQLIVAPSRPTMWTILKALQAVRGRI